MADRANFIFPECYVDTNIMKTLLHLDGVNHKHGCSKVIAGMKTGRFADCFAVGIIDDDTKKTYDYSDFVELAHSDHLRLMKHKSKHHYLIFVCKAAETFLLSCADELKLDLSTFDLPSSLEGLKEVTKDCESDKEPRIKKLINALRTSSEMSRLERTINYLLSNQYTANIDELIALFRR